MIRPLVRARGMALAFLTFALAACGGGGGGGGGGNPPPGLRISTASLADATIGVPYTETVITSGGSGNTTFTLSGGDLPPGLELDEASGVISGTPAGPTGTSNFTLNVEDSATPPGTASRELGITVNAVAVGRNDTVDDATPLGNGTFSASISPSGDPSGGFDPDEDYYSITTTAASTVTVDINAQVNGSPLDSVIELLDDRGSVINACGAPNYNSECVSDDEDLGVDLDSFLEARLGAGDTVFIHVVDWGMDARPDKLYDLVISGVN